MKLTILGAAHEVTGSCFLLEANGKNILIDCGMEQGKDTFENQEIPVPVPEIDVILLTHAHIDHSGNIPALFAKGYRGQVHATKTTKQLCDIMLRDSAHIQMQEAEWKNRKNKRSGGETIVPLYTMEHAMGVLRLFVPHRYNEKFKLFDGVEVRFIDAGHLLGSASIEVWITEGNVTKKIVFSGDIGNVNQPLIKDPTYIKDADYVVMESTYGDRNHGEHPDYIHELTKVLKETFERGGNVVIPAFAVGRTQTLLYYMREIKSKGLLQSHNNFKVYIDSPLAIEASNIFQENMMDNFDEEAMALVKKGINPMTFPGLNIATTVEESKEINEDNECKVIISASGMADAGRIRHHLKHNLWRDNSTVLIVGFQSPGTLGRILLDGVKEVKLFGERIQVKAHIKRLPGVSGHADREGLLKWINSFEKKPEKVFVVHGDTQVCQMFTETLRNEYGHSGKAPYSGAVYDLLTNSLIQEGVRIPVSKKSSKKGTTVYQRLVDAGNHLIRVIRKNEGGANKDLRKFTEQINALSNKWDR